MEGPVNELGCLFRNMAQHEVTKASLALVLVLICMAGLSFRFFYNLYLHPLRKIPGPMPAAMTSWPDFYYDVIKDGSYLFEIRKMHEQHGELWHFSICGGLQVCERLHGWQEI